MKCHLHKKVGNKTIIKWKIKKQSNLNNFRIIMTHLLKRVTVGKKSKDWKIKFQFQYISLIKCLTFLQKIY